MKHKFAICNELFQGWTLEDILRLASALGYHGVEIAPFTITDDVRKFSREDRKRIKSMASSYSVQIVGIHWILVSPIGLHITHFDPFVRNQTKDYLMELIRFTSDIGAKTMVLGSPKQRNILEGMKREEAWEFMRQTLRECCEEAAKSGIYICLEPLSRNQTNMINTTEEALAMLNDVGHPNLRINLDVYSMSDEGKPMDELIRHAGPMLAHFHANDTNGRGPGHGDADYQAIAKALKEIEYRGFISVEILEPCNDPLAMAVDSMINLRKFFW